MDKRLKNDFHFWVKGRLEKEYSVSFDEQRNYVFYIPVSLTETTEAQNAEFTQKFGSYLNGTQGGCFEPQTEKEAKEKIV